MRRIASFGLSAALALGGCWSPGPPELSAEADRAVRALVAQAQATEAVEDWRAAADRLRAEGRPLEAADALLRARVDDGRPPAVQGELAQIYVELGYAEAAVRELQPCLKSAPEEPECLLALGEFLQESQRPTALRQARRAYSSFLAVAPDHPAAAQVRSRLTQLGGALRAPPSGAQRAAEGGGGRAAAETGAAPGALDDETTQDGEKPELNVFGAALAKALQAAREGRTEDAVIGFEAALDIQPGNPAALAGLAEAQLANGDTEASVQTMGQALQVAGEDPQVLFVAGALAQRRGDVEETRRRWGALRELHPAIAEQLGIPERLAAMTQRGGQVSAPGRPLRPGGQKPADGSPDDN